MRYLLILLGLPLCGAEYSAPAGIRPALRRPGAGSILPGGRIISPLGHQYITGPGPFGLAISPSGKTLVSANSGPDRFSLTILEQEKGGGWQVRQLVALKPKKPKPGAGKGADKDGDKDDEWHSVFMGLAFASEHTVYVSEGNTGRVRLVDLTTGGARKIYDLNRDGFADSFTGDLAFDADRGVVYVLDQANFRLVAIDTRKQRVLSSVRLGRLPFALALSPDKRKAYVTNVGMFEYQAVPGVDVHNLRETGLPFPAFGFPSPESRDGVRAADRQRPSRCGRPRRSQRAGGQLARRGGSGRSGGAQSRNIHPYAVWRSVRASTAAAVHPAWWRRQIACSSRTRTTIPSR